MARHFTRKEFYDLVWSKPMTHLGKELVLSDVALHKICKKHDVPNPPLGWWAKKAAGQRVKQTPLPRLKKGVSDQIIIYGGEPRKEPELILKARENARVLMSGISRASETPSNHIVERTIAQLLGQKPSEINGLVSVEKSGIIKIAVAPASAERLGLALNRLVEAAEQLGIMLVKTEKSAAFECEGELMNFTVVEATKRHNHVVTESEKIEELRLKRENERKYGREIWESISSFMRPKIPEWDYAPTGQMALQFEHRYWREGSPRRTYRDAKTQRLENMSSDMAVGIAALAAAIKHDRLLREAEVEREEERKRQREAALRNKFVEERRGSALDALLSEVGEVARLRRLVSSLHEHYGKEHLNRVGAFVAFAKAQLIKREGQLSAEALERKFADIGLFGDDDDRDFHPPHDY